MQDVLVPRSLLKPCDCGLHEAVGEVRPRHSATEAAKHEKPTVKLEVADSWFLGLYSSISEPAATENFKEDDGSSECVEFEEVPDSTHPIWGLTCSSFVFVVFAFPLEPHCWGHACGRQPEACEQEKI